MRLLLLSAKAPQRMIGGTLISCGRLAEAILDLGLGVVPRATTVRITAGSGTRTYPAKGPAPICGPGGRGFESPSLTFRETPGIRGSCSCLRSRRSVVTGGRDPPVTAGT
jgi:hypothetical protein